MRKLAHETVLSRKQAGIAPEDQSDFAVGDRVIADGFPGVVAAVQPGFAGNESYAVVLDNGVGGGEYSAGQLYREPTVTASAQYEAAETSRDAFEVEATTAHTSADYWYPELDTILTDRPPPENLKVYAAKSHYDRGNEAFDAGHEHGYAFAGRPEQTTDTTPENEAQTLSHSWYDQAHAHNVLDGWWHGYQTWHNEAETGLPHKGGAFTVQADDGGSDGGDGGTGEDDADPADDLQDATGGQSNLYWPPDVCSWCGSIYFGQPTDTGRGHRVKCRQCGGTMNKTYGGIQWQPDFANAPGNEPSRRGDPRATINDPRSVHTGLALFEPVGAPLNVAASVEAGYLIYDLPLTATATLSLDLGEHARDFGFEFTSAWRDVVAKAKRIRKEGGVRVLAASGEGVVGEVDGDNAIYESEFRYVPGTKRVAYWHCGCKWASYAWGRSPAYRRFEGRACSHNMALRYEANARGMFGREVTVDQMRLPGQHQRTPVQVQHQRGTDRAPEREIRRRSVPPGNMRRQFASSLTPAHEWSSVALASGVNPAEVLTTLRGLGMAHEAARDVLSWAVAGSESCVAYADGAAHQVAYIDGRSIVTTAGIELPAEAIRYEAMAWHEMGGRGGMSAEKAKVRSVRDAGFKGYVSGSESQWEDSPEHHGEFDEDAWDDASPEPTAHEHAHFLQHDEYPESYHERHEHAYGEAMDKKAREDEPDHMDDHLEHFVIEHGQDSDLWKHHEPQPQKVDISKGVYATQSHVGQFHIDRHLNAGGQDTPWHLQHGGNDTDYLGNEHPMFVTHEGRLHATEGHHRIAAAIQRGDSHIMGWHYNLDAHPHGNADQWDDSPDGKCSTCKDFTGDEDEHEHQHAASLHTAVQEVGGFGSSPSQDYRPKTRHSDSDNPASTGWGTSADPQDWVLPLGYSDLTHWNASLHTAAKDDGDVTHAGVALKAGDTGRVLMIQRSHKDESDPARGTWEFPGGGLEPGDKTSLHGGIREWEEEVGQSFPEGAHMTGATRNKNYVLHHLVTPNESDVDFSNGRATTNPDDPDGDDHEQSAWWEVDHAKKNPALRNEVKKTPWDEIKKAAGVSPVTFAENVRGPAEQSTYKPAEAWHTTAVLHDEPEPALPFTEGDGASEEPDQLDVGPQDATPVGLPGVDQPPQAGLPVQRAEPWGYPEGMGGPQPAAPGGVSNDELQDLEDPSALDDEGSDAFHAEASLDGVNPILAEFWKTAGGAALRKDATNPESKDSGKGRPGEAEISDGDIAAAARAVLAKVGAKDFSFAEQRELIEEGLSAKARARNFDELQIDGTHYANIDTDEDDLYATFL